MENHGAESINLDCVINHVQNAIRSLSSKVKRLRQIVSNEKKLSYLLSGEDVYAIIEDDPRPHGRIRFALYFLDSH